MKSESAATSTKINVPASTSFASTSGTNFNVDGRTKYLAGTNSYWISFLNNNNDVEKALDTLKNSGLKVLRIWGFNDVTSKPGSGTVYFQHLSASGSTINIGADGLQRLDYVVAAAEIRGIKLIINFVNNWDDYGGISAYVSAFGGSKTSWYTNTAAQAQYRKYIEAVVSRYASSPAVFAWELANEPRCNGCSTDVIYNWAASTSAYVKSLDPNHMVTLGDEGMGLPGDGSYPYQYGEGTDFVKNLGIKTLDFGTFHMYPDHWGTNYDWGNGWIEAHGKGCVAAGKPCMLEECEFLSTPFLVFGEIDHELQMARQRTTAKTKVHGRRHHWPLPEWPATSSGSWVCNLATAQLTMMASLSMMELQTGPVWLPTTWLAFSDTVHSIIMTRVLLGFNRHPIMFASDRRENHPCTSHIESVFRFLVLGATTVY